MKAPFPCASCVLIRLLLLASLPARAFSAETAEDFVPPRVEQQVHVQFPVRALNQGITSGEVWLFVEVDRVGRLGDVLAFAHSGTDFANAAVYAIKQWRFIPARFAEESVASINRINVQFEVNGVTTHTKMPDQSDERAAPGERFAYRPFALPELDRIPKAISQPSPVYPKDWIRQGKAGVVVVDYFIDEEGHTRFPRVVGNPDELLGASAVEAVKRWQFEPPSRQGQRVLAQVRQEILFQSEAAKAERK
jgi:TonB family protein